MHAINPGLHTQHILLVFYGNEEVWNKHGRRNQCIHVNMKHVLDLCVICFDDTDLEDNNYIYYVKYHHMLDN